jgi:type II secretory pathway component PulJ
MQQLRKHLRAAAFHRGRDDGRRAEQALAVETGEEVAAGGGEEGGEA